MNKLTAKQENFAKAIALKEMNYSDAYRDAYNTAKMKDEVINKEASILLKDRNITVRIKELKAEIDTKTIEKLVITKMKLVEELEDIRKEAKEDKDRKIEIDCIKEQGKLEGLYIEQSKDLTKSEFKTWLKNRE